jgi:hypothetical protein
MPPLCLPVNAQPSVSCGLSNEPATVPTKIVVSRSVSATKARIGTFLQGFQRDLADLPLTPILEGGSGFRGPVQQSMIGRQIGWLVTVDSHPSDSPFKR